MKCLFCGKALSRLSFRRDGDFCCREHRDRYRLRQGLNQVQEAHEFNLLYRRRECPHTVRLDRPVPSSAAGPRVCTGEPPAAARCPADSLPHVPAGRRGPHLSPGAALDQSSPPHDSPELPQRRTEPPPEIRPRLALGQWWTDGPRRAGANPAAAERFGLCSWRQVAGPRTGAVAARPGRAVAERFPSARGGTQAPAVPVLRSRPQAAPLRSAGLAAEVMRSAASPARSRVCGRMRRAAPGPLPYRGRLRRGKDEARRRFRLAGASPVGGTPHHAPARRRSQGRVPIPAPQVVLPPPVRTRRPRPSPCQVLFRFERTSEPVSVRHRTVGRLRCRMPEPACPFVRAPAAHPRVAAPAFVRLPLAGRASAASASQREFRFEAWPDRPLHRGTQPGGAFAISPVRKLEAGVPQPVAALPRLAGFSRRREAASFLPQPLLFRPVRLTIQGTFAGTVEDIRSGAPFQMEENFASGLARWAGGAANWRLDAAGVRPGSLALFSPSLQARDYVVEFLGKVELGALTWVFRAGGIQNYYAIRITLTEGADGQSFELCRHAVIGGVEEPSTVVPLPVKLRNKAAFKVQTRVEGNDFTTSIDGCLVDRWSDSRLPEGGIGFLAEQEARVRLYWVKLSSPGRSSPDMADAADSRGRPSRSSRAGIRSGQSAPEPQGPGTEPPAAGPPRGRGPAKISGE